MATFFSFPLSRELRNTQLDAKSHLEVSARAAQIKRSKDHRQSSRQPVSRIISNPASSSFFIPPTQLLYG